MIINFGEVLHTLQVTLRKMTRLTPPTSILKVFESQHIRLASKVTINALFFTRICLGMLLMPRDFFLYLYIVQAMIRRFTKPLFSSSVEYLNEFVGNVLGLYM